MRTIVDHAVGGLNEVIKIEVLDEPGDGGACHEYRLSFGHTLSESGDLIPEYEGAKELFIEFQNGPLLEAGVNGFSGEALIAVVIDRMRGFQSGQFACRENAIALTKLEEALMWLQKRTQDRLRRGVEGTHIK